MYTNFYSPSAVCSPSRSAIITGMYPTTLGTHNMRAYNEGRKSINHNNLPSYSPKFPKKIKPLQLLRNAGYYLLIVVKKIIILKFQKTHGIKLAVIVMEKKKLIFIGVSDLKISLYLVFNFKSLRAQIWHQANKPIFVDVSKVEVPPIFR